MDAISDEALADAVANCHSWRGVLRALNLPDAASSTTRAARRRAAALGLDCSHFTGARTWSDAQLRDAVAESDSWAAVLARLGLAATDGGTATAVRRHALRMQLPTQHLTRPRPADDSPFALQASARNLRTAGALLAAAWFALRGRQVVWPLEPCRYDFLAECDGRFLRIQVKTTTYRSPDRAAVAAVSATRRRYGRTCYGPEEVDYFFIIDAELNAYLIPITAVSGYQQIYLRKYRAFLVAARGGWLTTPAREPDPV